MIDALARRKNGGGEGGSPGRESPGESSSIESIESSQELFVVVMTASRLFRTTQSARQHSY